MWSRRLGNDQEVLMWMQQNLLKADSVEQISMAKPREQISMWYQLSQVYPDAEMWMFRQLFWV